MPAVLNDTDMVSAIRLKNRAGYDTIYEQYGCKLYGMILTAVDKEKDAAAIFSETMRDIWHRIEEYDPSKMELMRWIVFRIIRPKTEHFKAIQRQAAQR